jgi:hypothetical protein
VITTVDRQTIANDSVVVIASDQSASAAKRMTTADTMAAVRTGMLRTRPLPTAGSRSSKVLRSGISCPRSVTTAMTTRNGAAVAQPGCETYRPISEPAMPSASDMPNVTGKDTNCPGSAAASAGTTSRTRLVGSRKMIGAIRMPARPASTEPSAQFSIAIVFGEWVRLAATSWFSATAVVFRPNELYRYMMLSATVDAMPIAKMIRMLRPIGSWCSPNAWMIVVGSTDGRGRGVCP